MNNVSVMLVEDDRIILDDLKSLIAWEKNDLSLIATAMNGKKALEYFNRYHPDIVVTDIIMPIMDGIELVKEIRAKNKDTEILMLTSYREFEYAQEAIKCGVSGYFLKNDISEDTLLEKLLMMKQSVIKKKNQRNQVLHHYIEYDLADVVQIAAESIHSYEKLIMTDKYYFLLINVCFPICLSEESEKNKAQAIALSKKLNDLWAADNDVFFHAVGTHHIMAAIYPADQSKKPSELFSETADTLNRLLEDLQIYSWSYCSVLQQMSIHEYLKNVYSAISSRHDAAFTEKCTICQFSERKTEKSFLPTKNILWKLREKIGELDLSQLQSLTNEYFNEAMSGQDFNSLLYFCRSSAQILEEYIQKKSDYAEKLGNPMEVENIYTAAQMRDWFFSSFAALFDHRNTANTKNVSHNTRQAIDFIRKNYKRQDLSIAEIAQHVFLSPGRLSVLFKKDTDQTVLDYLTDVRMSHACRLLKNTSLKIYEIAEEVGYGSSQYFSQIFFQHVGMRPNDFRNKS